jgi:hypothetical protein
VKHNDIVNQGVEHAMGHYNGLDEGGQQLMMKHLLSDFYKGLLHHNDVPIVSLLSGKTGHKTYRLETDDRDAYFNMLRSSKVNFIPSSDQSNGKYVYLFDADPSSEQFETIVSEVQAHEMSEINVVPDEFKQKVVVNRPVGFMSDRGNSRSGGNDR